MLRPLETIYLYSCDLFRGVPFLFPPNNIICRPHLYTPVWRKGHARIIDLNPRLYSTASDKLDRNIALARYRITQTQLHRDRLRWTPIIGLIFPDTDMKSRLSRQ